MVNLRKIIKAAIPMRWYQTVEPYGHWAEAALATSLQGGSPAKNLKVIGVTGTNGKTTTCFMIHAMLHEAGYKVGLMTTVGYGAGQDIRPQALHMTNVPVPQMLARLKQLRAQGIEWLVMEVTSHALAQHRDFGIPYSVAVLTNITHEHLDYHGTFERYVAAKLKLFKKTNRNRRGLRTGVINADDKHAGQFRAAIDKSLTYGITSGQLRASQLELSAAGAKFKAAIGDEAYTISCRLPGRFNVYNALAAIGVGRTLGLSQRQIEQGIASLPSVQGRMTSLSSPQGFGVIVDFAHSPDALQNVLVTARELTKGRVILVFGATGDRDKLKRPTMGQVAAKYADQIFLTDDETYTEDPAAIIQAVYKGIAAAGGQNLTTIVEDRLAAIKAALAAAKTGDTVLLTGIGHQTTRNMGGKEAAWDEIQIVGKLLK